MTAAFVTVKGLWVDYLSHGGDVSAVRDVSFEIARGGSYGLVGESGSGKSTILTALVGPVNPRMRVRAEELAVAGHQVLTLTGAALRGYRMATIGMVYQEPGSALNPTMTVGAQIAEVYRVSGSTRRQARELGVTACESVGLPEPGRIVRRYPHQLSGGQQQRVVIAMALANDPDLLLLDEPTTGLDSQVEAEIFDLIERLRHELHFATLLISHDLPLVARHCESVGVLRHGELVEHGESNAVINMPVQAYTRELVAAVPEFHTEARAAPPARGRVVMVQDVSKQYGGTRALHEISFRIEAGETLGIVGESGSGKSTLGRVLAGLISYEGEVRFDHPGAANTVQLVFQNPDSSLNPRRTVRQTLSRSLALLGGDGTVDELAERVGIAGDLLGRLPRELSGGQKQRVAIARAFAGEAALVVCDEPTSALDVQVQARVLDLLLELQEHTGVAYLFISHDLAVVRQLAHRIGVMRAGELVELQTAADVFARPRHPYTTALIEAAQSVRGPNGGTP